MSDALDSLVFVFIILVAFVLILTVLGLEKDEDLLYCKQQTEISYELCERLIK